MELLDQQCAGDIGEFSVNLCANRRLTFAFGEHIGGFLPQVLLICHLGEKDIGIPGHFDHGSLEDTLLFQQQRKETPNQLVCDNDLLCTVNFETEIGGNPVHWDDGELLDGSLSKKGYHIALFAPEERNRLIDVNDLREQQVFDIPEEFFAHQLVNLVYFIEVQDLNPVAFEFRANCFPYTLCETLLLPCDPEYFVDGLLGEHPGNRISLLRSKQSPMGQDPDADPIELFQIRLIDHQKLQSFQQRHRGIRRLQKNTFIEAQPAELTIDIKTFRLFDSLSNFILCGQSDSLHSELRL